LVHLGFDIGAHYARRALRPQCQARFLHVLIDERVHLFFDDVGGLAERAAEELGTLDDRDADLGEIIQAKDLARLVLDELPDLYFAGHNVGEALDGRNLHGVNGSIESIENIEVAPAAQANIGAPRAFPSAPDGRG
jgi:hypothetical protein